jgi:iron complex transport system substrate-binding protein
MTMIRWFTHRRHGRAAALSVTALAALAVAIPTLTHAHASAAPCPRRIVSLSPTATEDLFADGAGRQVVAVDSDSNYPAHAPRKSGLNAYSPNAEAIAGDYNPDLVVVSYDANRVVEQLHALGIRVLFEPTAKNLAAAYDQIEGIGEATCHTADSVRVVGSIKRQIATIRAASTAKARGLVYYDEISAPPYDYAASSKSFIGQLFGLLGMRNITTSGADNGFPELSQEYIVKASPQLIFLSDNEPIDGGVTATSVEHRTGWKSIRAVKAHAIYGLNDDAASRWGPRVTVLLREIATAVSTYRRTR